MKKFLALVLALVLSFSCLTVGFAAETAGAEKVDPSISSILDEVKSFFTDSKILDKINPIIEKILEFIKGLVPGDNTAGVEGAIGDLEKTLKDNKIDICGKIKELIDCLKSKIKALYCGEPATEEEVKPETGSASIGLSVFGALCVASAAAFVCTKKKVA